MDDLDEDPNALLLGELDGIDSNTIIDVPSCNRSVLKPQNAGVKKNKRGSNHALSATALRELGEAVSATLFSGSIFIPDDREASFLAADQVYKKPIEEATKEFVLWTDGSCSGPQTGPGGAAVVFKQHPHREDWVEVPFLVLGQRDINDIELVAVEQALKIAVQRYPQMAGQNKVVIFSDSKSIIQWIRKGRVAKGYNSKNVLTSICKLADELVAMSCQVELRWVKGHGPIPGNVRADAVAVLTRKLVVYVHNFIDADTANNFSGDSKAWRALLKNFEEEQGKELERKSTEDPAEVMNDLDANDHGRLEEEILEDKLEEGEIIEDELKEGEVQED